jgi:hypothetical protein
LPGFSHDRLFWPLLLDAQPDIVGRAGVPVYRTVFYAGGDLHEPWQRVIEELPVTFTEITFSFAILIIPVNPAFHTSAAADIEVSANEAFVT